jgi:transcriptional regulator with XRE-family HTH domain
MYSTATYFRNRKLFANRLKCLRELSGYSNEQVASGSSLNILKLEHFESGLELPTQDEIHEWAGILNLPLAEYGMLTVLLQQAEAEYIPWQTNYNLAGGPSCKQQEVQVLEKESTRIYEFQLCLIPGLLQSHEYARCVFNARFGPLCFGASPNYLEDALSVRKSRQQIIEETGRVFSFVMPMACLMTCISSSQIQRNQIRKLINLSSLPNVHIGIIPYDKPLPLIPINCFSIYDEKLVIIESLSGEQQLTGRGDVDLYVDAFLSCAAVAAKGEDAIALMNRAIAEQS